MSRLSIALALSACLVTIPLSSAGAWDSERRGFLLGFGLGAGYEMWSLDSADHCPAFTWDLLVGWAPRNTLMIYFTEALWITDDPFLVNGLLGLSAFKDESSPSPFVTVGVGFIGGSAPVEDEESAAASASDDESEQIEDVFGLGITLGFGYEFASHFNVELNLAFAPLNDFFPFVASIMLNTIGY